MPHILAYALTTVICLMASCKDTGVDPPLPPPEKKWEVVPGSFVSVRFELIKKKAEELEKIISRIK